jgi:hypothetical protein
MVTRHTHLLETVYFQYLFIMLYMVIFDTNDSVWFVRFGILRI